SLTYCVTELIHPHSSTSCPLNPCEDLPMNKTLLVAIAAASALVIGAAPATAQDDPTIVFIFDQANTVDIETGNLAAKKGHSAEVREFGAMLARDHDMVRKMGRDLAAKLGVTPTAPADNAATTKAHAETMARLNKLSGAEFDHAFLQYEVS